MKLSIQVAGCVSRDVEGEVEITPFVSDEVAEFYGVYVQGSDGLFSWAADIRLKAHALEFGQLIADTAGFKLSDQTFSEKRVH